MKHTKRPVKPMFQAVMQAQTLELYIYDKIGKDYYGPGIGAQDVAEAIKSQGSFQDILLRINSPGGSVFEGSAIYNLLQSQGKPITVIVDGLAASAAFTIAMVGDTIKIGEGGMMMLHNGWSLVAGDAAMMRQEADLLDKVSGVAQGIYARRANKTMEEVKAMMDAETWFTPEEAIQNGFADEVMGTSAEDASAAKALATQLLARSKAVHFAHVPEELKQKVEAAPNETTGCACPCPECIAGNCADCTMADCDYDGCNHDMEDSDDLEIAEEEGLGMMAHNRLRLRELSLKLVN